jgi:hypothetical protein
LAVKAPVDCEPLSDLLPDQPPEAEHAVVFCVDQESTEAAPDSTVLGAAVIVMAVGDRETVTVVDCVAEPPGPVQVSSYSDVLVSAPVDQVPLVATAPCQPPEAVHAVACNAVHVSVDDSPFATVVGEAARVTAGTCAVTATSAVCAAEPPGPVQVNMYLVSVVRGGVVVVPLIGCVPLQPPEAEQVCALVALHFSVAGVPGSTLALIASNERAGLTTLPAVLLSRVSLLAELPHAARAEKAKPTIAHWNRREILMKGSVCCLLKK